MSCGQGASDGGDELVSDVGQRRWDEFEDVRRAAPGAAHVCHHPKRRARTDVLPSVLQQDYRFLAKLRRDAGVAGGSAAYRRKLQRGRAFVAQNELHRAVAKSAVGIIEKNGRNSGRLARHKLLHAEA